uniref:Peptidase A2 domain-containing protein n=1 Tax=Oryzias latipes TaxID=8090 RepID=A0A3P9MIM2_ORYLA
KEGEELPSFTTKTGLKKKERTQLLACPGGKCCILIQPSNCTYDTQHNVYVCCFGFLLPPGQFFCQTFSGSGRDWSDWAEQFEIAADVNNWDDALKLKFMSLLLSGRAREVYSGLSPSAKANYLSLKEAMSCLSLRRYYNPGDLNGWIWLSQGKKGGFDCHALIDTGASRSVISKSMWLVITNGGTDLGNYVGKATTVNGGKLVVLGSWQTVCQLATLTLPVEFLVSELTSDEILLDLGQNVCQIKGKCFPLVPSNPSPAAKQDRMPSEDEGSGTLEDVAVTCSGSAEAADGRGEKARPVRLWKPPARFQDYTLF